MAYGIDTIYEKETGNKITFAPSKNPEGGKYCSVGRTTAEKCQLG